MRARSRRSCGSPSTRWSTSAGVLAGRLGRRSADRSGRAVPRPSRRGPHLLQPEPAVGRVPQICCLFGPSAAGGAYIPAFCDVVIMVEGNASMYLGSPRMVEMVVGEPPRSRRWAVRGCTRPSPAAATTSPSTTPTRSRRRATSRTCRRTGGRRRPGTPPKRRRRPLDRATSCPGRAASPSTCTT